jgi:hypothetical protein
VLPEAIVQKSLVGDRSSVASIGKMATNNDQVTVNLTYAAFAISISAFILASLQVLLAYLQFDNSEVGRRRCSAEVMGELWAKKTERKFKWREWRYQIFFEVPVLYTAPPGYEFTNTHFWCSTFKLSRL